MSVTVPPDIAEDDARDEPLVLPPGDDALRFPCRACGATLSFTPGADALRCPYCGHAEEIAASDAEVEELPFESWQARGEPAGWGVERVEYHCDACGANTAVEPHITAFRCAFCSSERVVRREETPQRARPRSLVPFSVGADDAQQAFRTWIGKLWFRPSALAKLARPGALSGVYLPTWTYDSLTHSSWKAESGTYYTVTVPYTDANGQRKTRQERRVRWRWVSGSHDAFFDDVQEIASPSLPRRLLDRVMPFDTTKLVGYQPQYLSGFMAEDYREDMLECWPRAQKQMEDRIRSAVIARIPGDTHRNLQVRTSYHNRTYKLALLPIWSGAYQYAGKAWSFVINGQSGRVAGEAPLSWAKITLAVLAAAAVAAGVYALVR